MQSDGQVLDELARAAEGLLFMSESDHPFRTVSWDAATGVTPDFLRDVAGKGAAAAVTAQGVGEFFRNAASEPEWKKGGALADARRYQVLVRLLQEHLSDVKVYRVGETDIAVFIIGRGPGGSWLGLSTRVIET